MSILTNTKNLLHKLSIRNTYLKHCKFTVTEVNYNIAICVIVSNIRFKMFNNKTMLGNCTKPLQIKKDELKGVKFELDLSKCDIILTN